MISGLQSDVVENITVVEVTSVILLLSETEIILLFIIVGY